MSVTPYEVLEIMNTSSLTEIQIAPFLTTAEAIVADSLSTSSLSVTVLDEIKKYLAAHLACMRSPFGIRKKMGDAEETYGYKGGSGLDATPYGETVKMLDSTGILLSKMSSQMVTLSVIDFATDDS